MDTRKFKKEYGKDLTIWGGSYDNQTIMPYGTPQEDKDETRRRIEDLAPGRGFIFAPIHVIQNGVPPENIMAWWQTLQENGTYQALYSDQTHHIHTIFSGHQLFFQ
jgi:uroporphyrinogen decarboxylase